MIAREYKLKPATGVSPLPARPRSPSFVAGSSSAGMATACPCETPPPDKHGEAQSHPRATYPDTSQQLIGVAEIRFLGIASAMAWKGEKAEMLKTEKLTVKEAQDNWRHAEVFKATGGRARGLRQCARADFRTVRAHFLALAGLTDRAFADLMRSGSTAHGDAVETVEQVDKWIFGILARVKKHFASQGPGAEQRVQAWFAAIVEWKERKLACKWTGWPVKERTQLYWTLKNRFAAMTGTGSTKNRNKGQRGKGKAEMLKTEMLTSEAELISLPENPF